MGPLAGVKIVEMGGIGPGPMCALLLADMGADIIRIDRMQETGLGVHTDPKFNLLMRGRKSIAVDTKTPEGRDLILDLVSQADGLIEGFRPGVMERLGLGPDEVFARNPKIAFGRMTGWGQDGPMAHAAGHDLNYIALSGALHAIGRKGAPPTPPLNLVGDFGGGALYLAMGMLAVILEARTSGKGQVVDVSMVDGAASLMTTFFGLRAAGRWTDERGSNILDSGAHFYDVYETSDGKYVSIGSIETKFYALLLKLTGLEGEDLPNQMDVSAWPQLRERFAEVFKTKTRDEWCDIMEGTDVCFAPVLSMAEATSHPHNVARETFVEIDGVVQPAPAPKFSRTKSEIKCPPPAPGAHTQEALLEWGVDQSRIDALREKAAIK
ncbi:CaiB/BaiF CoA transferase family protein [Sneathiella chinensis]|uniref:Alpha-methylacyl-CoA racemase n=1 Tax=Sneathiella chinensis TaxID=349750 RepID=A0ABQ5U325_9PROT|nr:CaiB/BaiF CoA-transferase family protein [Sneathiella chinensis]GLQ05742.1 alpha-methylacyl-CoA racemase [Sneathiella chinensis]